MNRNKKLIPFETRYNDLLGIVSIKLDDKQDFNSLGAMLMGYDPENFEAIALRVYIDKSPPVVTVYAIDTFKKEQMGEGAYKIPVRKFKKEMSLDDLFYSLRNINFTVTTGDYDIENMEVVNK